MAPLQIPASITTGGYRSEAGLLGTVSGITSITTEVHEDTLLPQPIDRTRMVDDPVNDGSHCIVPLLVI